MAGLDPAIPMLGAPPYHVIGIAGSSPAMTADGRTSIPVGRAGPVDDPAARMGEPGDLGHLGRRQLEVENRKVRGKALGPRTAGNDDRATLNEPAQPHLPGGLAMPGADPPNVSSESTLPRANGL